jgi:hypothetical protein
LSQAFFTFECAEREVIDARRGNPFKLGLALHIGFRRMSGRLLSTFQAVPALWRHLGNAQPPFEYCEIAIDHSLGIRRQ